MPLAEHGTGNEVEVRDKYIDVVFGWLASDAFL